MAYGPFGPGFVGSPSSGSALFNVGGTSGSGFPLATPTPNSDLVKKSFAQTVQYLLPRGDATLLGLSARVKEETALSIEHGFYSKVLVFPMFVLTGIGASPATNQTFTVADSSQCIVGGLYRYSGPMDVSVTPAVPGTPVGFAQGASEVILVTGVTNATTITVKRNVGLSFGNTVGTGVAYAPTTTASPLFTHIGNAQSEGSTRPVSVLTKEVRVVNWTQIFRNAWQISGTVSAIQNLVGDTNIAKSKQECAQYHGIDQEKSLLWGSGAVDDTGTYQLRTLKGMVAQIQDASANALYLPGSAGASSNLTTAASNAVAGQLSIKDLEAFANNTFDMAYDPMSALERVAFVGRTAHTVLNTLARGNSTYFMENGQTDWGLRFSRMHLTRGDLIIIEHPAFNTNIHWQNAIMLLDISAISVAYMIGRKTKAEEYNQNGVAIDNAIDATGGSLLTELTVMNRNPAGCGIMSNVKVAVSNSGTVL